MPSSTPAEIDALAATCERLQGFDGLLSLECVDGMLCALAASPRQPRPAHWLPLLFDDSFERAFGDPEDHARALQSVQARLRVLLAQLDPEALFEEPEALRLDPLVMDWSDEAKAALIAEQQLGAKEAEELQSAVTGGEWAAGFLHAVEQLGALWDIPDGDDEASAAFDAAFEQISILTYPPGHDHYARHLATYYPTGGRRNDGPGAGGDDGAGAGAGAGGDGDGDGDGKPDASSAAQPPPTRDDLLAEACMSVQDLRMYWVDFAPRTETIRVDAKPGRNDPCPCGSGKKYKKCHGAAA